MHTPGDWKSSGIVNAGMFGEESIIITANGVNIARLFTPNGPTGCKSNAPRGYREVLANANLMASAPELLDGIDALRKTVADILDNCPYFFPAGGDKSKLTDEQRAWRTRVEAASKLARKIIGKAKDGAS